MNLLSAKEAWLTLLKVGPLYFYNPSSSKCHQCQSIHISSKGKFVRITEIAWDKAPHWGEKEKKYRRAKRAERCSLGRGKTTAGLTSLADYFSHLTPFFAFFLYCGAWSRAILKWSPKGKINALIVYHILSTNSSGNEWRSVWRICLQLG